MEESLYPVWDTDENMQAIITKVKQLTSGCKCKRGCGTGQCGCKKSGRECGPGCACTNCKNTQKDEQESNNDIVAQEQEILDSDSEEEPEYVHYEHTDDTEYYENLEKEVDDIMKEIFGE